jgi:hypothetical protein
MSLPLAHPNVMVSPLQAIYEGSQMFKPLRNLEVIEVKPVDFSSYSPPIMNAPQPGPKIPASAPLPQYLRRQLLPGSL